MSQIEMILTYEIGIVLIRYLLVFYKYLQNLLPRYLILEVDISIFSTFELQNRTIFVHPILDLAYINKIFDS